MFKRIISIELVLLLGLACIAGCGPTVRLAPQAYENNSGVVLVLPVRRDPSVHKRRAEAMRTILENELAGAGYLVLQREYVDRVCDQPLCRGSAAKLEKYAVTALIEPTLNSVSEYDFLAGYHNAIRGNIAVYDTAGREQASIKHVEHEQGGLLFNSGQIVQGVISQVRNRALNNLDYLLAKFVKEVVAELPRPNRTDYSVLLQPPKVEHIQLRENSASDLLVCAKGTPGLAASLVLGRERANLREVRSGRYCGHFSPEAFKDEELRKLVELRAPYGTLVSQEIALEGKSYCPIDRRVRLEKRGVKAELQILCIRLGSGQAIAANQCAQMEYACKKGSFLAFQTVSRSEGIRPLGFFRSVRYTVPWEEGARYWVVSVGSRGDTSVPVEARMSLLGSTSVGGTPSSKAETEIERLRLFSESRE